MHARRGLLVAAIDVLLAVAGLGAVAACAARSSQPAPAHEVEPAPAAAVPTPEPVVAAERAFAADGLALGIKKSFLKHSTDDAIILQPGPVNAHEAMGEMPDPEPGAKLPQLVWWPLWAGVARSGELGFTTGPFRFNDKPVGHYFTVWKKQPDGYGDARWSAGGQPKRGHYVRVWQKREAGWRLVFDQIVPYRAKS